MKITFLSFIFIFLIGCASNSNYFYLGDRTSNSIIKVHEDSFKKLNNNIKTHGNDPYEIKSNDNKIYAINREDYHISVYNQNSDNNIEELSHKIELPIKPRSAVFNNESILLSSTSNASLLLIDKKTQKLVKTYSDGEGEELNYGGKYKSAHPTFVNKDRFILTDRSENALELYKSDSSHPISKLKLDTSVHHLIHFNGFFYGALEGKNHKNIAPGIIKIKIENDKLVLVKKLSFLNIKNKAIKELNKYSWGGHHLAIDKKNKKIYMGSKEGNVFIINSDDLSFYDIFLAGKGAGHIMLKDNMAIVTNHFDSFKTIYDIKTRRTYNIHTNEIDKNKKYQQSHSSWYENYILTFVANGNKLVKIDIKNKKIKKELSLGKNTYSLIGTKIKNK